jgi:Bacterial type II/III secretion system short domain
MRSWITLVIAVVIGIVNVGAVSVQAQPGGKPADRNLAEAELLRERCLQLEAAIRKLEVELVKQEKAKAQAAEQIGISIVTVKDMPAADLAKTLRELFPEKSNPSLTIAGNAATNSVLIRGLPAQRAEVEAVVQRLETLWRDRRLQGR